MAHIDREESSELDERAVARLIAQNFLPKHFNLEKWRTDEQARIEREYTTALEEYSNFKQNEYDQLHTQLISSNGSPLLEKLLDIYCYDRSGSHVKNNFIHPLHYINGGFQHANKIQNGQTISVKLDQCNGFPWYAWQRSSHYLTHIGDIFMNKSPNSTAYYHYPCSYIKDHKPECIDIATQWTTLGYTIVYVTIEKYVTYDRDHKAYVNIQTLIWPCDIFNTSVDGLLFIVRKFP